MACSTVLRAHRPASAGGSLSPDLTRRSPARQPRGRRRLKDELRQKGVDREVVEQALEEAELDEYPAALELARKRLPSLRGDEPLAQRRRLAGFLQRRGYGWDVVGRVLDAALGEPDDNEELA